MVGMQRGAPWPSYQRRDHRPQWDSEILERETREVWPDLTLQMSQVQGNVSSYDAAAHQLFLSSFLHRACVLLMIIIAPFLRMHCRHRPTDRGAQRSRRGETRVVEGKECPIGGVYQGACTTESGCVGSKRAAPRPGPVRIAHRHGKASQVSVQVHGWGTVGSSREVALSVYGQIMESSMRQHVSTCICDEETMVARNFQQIPRAAGAGVRRGLRPSFPLPAP